FITFVDLKSSQQCLDASPFTIDDDTVYVVSSQRPPKNGLSFKPLYTDSQTNSYNSNNCDELISASESKKYNSSSTHNIRDYRKSVYRGLSEFQYGVLACVVYLDSDTGIAFIQEVLQRTKMFDLSDDINDYGESNSLLIADNLKPGDKVIVTIKKKFYRGVLADDMTKLSYLSDLRVTLIDIGETTYVKSVNLYVLPKKFQSIEPLCKKVYFDGLSNQNLREIFKDMDYCLTVFGDSLNIFHTKASDVKWFTMVTVEKNFDIPAIKLFFKSNGKCLNDILRKHLQNNSKHVPDSNSESINCHSCHSEDFAQNRKYHGQQIRSNHSENNFKDQNDDTVSKCSDTPDKSIESLKTNEQIGQVLGYLREGMQTCCDFMRRMEEHLRSMQGLLEKCERLLQNNEN
ncbi:hypothetical protein GJ496_003506, partial [Pomphorhynchus laevis]